MKTIAALFVIVISLAGCKTNVDLNPQYNGGVYDVIPYEVFNGMLNGTQTPFSTDRYQCNIADNYVYDLAGAAYMNSDGSQVTCDPLIYNRTYASESANTAPVIR